DLDVIEPLAAVTLFNPKARVVDVGSDVRRRRLDRRGLLDLGQARLGDTGPFQAGDVRARSFLDVEPQHADRSLDRQWAADDFGLEKSFFVVALSQRLLDHRAIEPRFDL